MMLKMSQDMEIAVLAYTLVQDEAEEGFWADDDSVTDTEPSDEDNDPECVSDRWDCVTCGLKNKPFVRYCSKCWQVSLHMLCECPFLLAFELSYKFNYTMQWYFGF